ncbi:CBS domain-containing protein [Cryptosporidium felis]|nr:CBS domain-containing protein [Cryptosporidium felis]
MREVVDLPFQILILISILLSFGSALFSGLTLGMMTQDLLYLKISAASKGNSRTAHYAKKLIPLRSDGNLLLVTLLFGNVTVNTGLSILISELTSGWLAFTVSTILIMILGEIIPQAICSKYGLYIGGFFSPLIRLIQIALYPILKPISYILDRCVGKNNEKVYSRQELFALLNYHSRKGVVSSRELELIRKLMFSGLSASDIMTPLDEFQVLDLDAQLDSLLINKLFRDGTTKIYITDALIHPRINSNFTSPPNISKRHDIIFLDIPKTEQKTFSPVIPSSPTTSETCDSDDSACKGSPHSKSGMILGYIDLAILSEQNKANNCLASPNKVSTIVNTKAFRRLTNVIITSDMMKMLQEKDTMLILSSISCIKDKILCVQSATTLSVLFDILCKLNFSQKDVIVIYSLVGSASKVRYDGVITQSELYSYLFHNERYLANGINGNDSVKITLGSPQPIVTRPVDPQS